MNKLSEIMKSPSRFDSLSNYIGEIPEDKWFCLLTQTRDSDCLTRSNFICALDLLGGEGDNVKVFRFGHWACGWWEALAISKSDEKACKIANEIERKIEAYPVLNDDHFSEKEHEAKCDMVDDYLDSFLRNLNIETPYAQLKDALADFVVGLNALYEENNHLAGKYFGVVLLERAEELLNKRESI